MVWGLAYKGFDDVCKFLGNTICDGLPTEKYGPKGCTCFVNFGKAIEFGGTALVAYNCLYLLVLRPPVCLISLRREGHQTMSLFLSWLVGFFGSTYRCWCLVVGFGLCLCSPLGP